MFRVMNDVRYDLYDVYKFFLANVYFLYICVHFAYSFFILYSCALIWFCAASVANKRSH